jgi:hypothetical protein
MNVGIAFARRKMVEQADDKDGRFLANATTDTRAYFDEPFLL